MHGDGALIILVLYGLLVLTIVGMANAAQLQAVRRRSRRAHALAVQLRATLGLSHSSGGAGHLLFGAYDGRPVHIEIHNGPFAYVRVPLPERAVPAEFWIHETLDWHYQYLEPIMDGETVRTGDPDFDLSYLAFGNDAEAAKRVPSRVREALVRHLRRGIQIHHGWLTLECGASTRNRGSRHRPDTPATVTETLGAAMALANDLERAAI